jgi:hypothetical protein
MPVSTIVSQTEESKSSNSNLFYPAINGSVASSELSDSVLWHRQMSIQQNLQPQDIDEGQLVENVGDKFAVKLLTKILKFFKNSYGELSDMDHKEVKPEFKETRLKELMEIKQKVKRMATQRYVFNAFTKNEDEIETIKQCFWLNILNFMTLFKLAEIKLTSPSTMR